MSADRQNAGPTASGIDIVWCDFGGVLTPDLSEAIGHIESASGLPWAVLADAIGKVSADLSLTGLQPLELGLMSQRDWATLLTEKLGPDNRPLVDLGDWDVYWYHDRPVNRDLLAVLAALHESGTRIGMLTNSVLEWEPHRERMLAGVDFLDTAVRSHEIALAKPDPRIFEHSDTVLVPKGRVVFIDDLPGNCEAARAHGWEAIHHVDTDTTIAELIRMSPAAPIAGPINA